MKKILKIFMLVLSFAFLEACAKESDQIIKLDDNMEERIYGIGDTVEKTSTKRNGDSEVLFSCKVKDVVLYRNIKDSGINTVDMVDYVDTYVPDGRETYGFSNEELGDCGYALLLVEADITNLAIDEEKENITHIYACEYKNPESMELNVISLPVYFYTPNECEEEEYYWFDLKKGETTSVVIGWLVNLEFYDSTKIVLSVGGECYIEADMKFVALELGDEDIK